MPSPSSRKQSPSCPKPTSLLAHQRLPYNSFPRTPTRKTLPSTAHLVSIFFFLNMKRFNVSLLLWNLRWCTCHDMYNSPVTNSRIVMLFELFAMEFGNNWLFNSPIKQVQYKQLHKHCNLSCMYIQKMKFLPPPIKSSSLVRRQVALHKSILLRKSFQVRGFTPVYHFGPESKNGNQWETRQILTGSLAVEFSRKQHIIRSKKSRSLYMVSMLRLLHIMHRQLFYRLE